METLLEEDGFAWRATEGDWFLLGDYDEDEAPMYLGRDCCNRLGHGRCESCGCRLRLVCITRTANTDNRLLCTKARRTDRLLRSGCESLHN